MLSPLFGIEDIRRLRADPDTPPSEITRLRDKSLLITATELAVAGAFKYGTDLPVGAAAAAGDWINGRYYASDRRAGYRQMHAEYMAVQDAALDVAAPRPDTVVVTLEPCDACQDFLATIPSIKRVGFGLPRREVEERGIVKPHGETIFERADRLGLPYEVVLISDPLLLRVGRTILDNVHRDPVREVVGIDTLKLQADFMALQATVE